MAERRRLRREEEERRDRERESEEAGQNDEESGRRRREEEERREREERELEEERESEREDGERRKAREARQVEREEQEKNDRAKEDERQRAFEVRKITREEVGKRKRNAGRAEARRVEEERDTERRAMTEQREQEEQRRVEEDARWRKRRDQYEEERVPPTQRREEGGRAASVREGGEVREGNERRVASERRERTPLVDREKTPPRGGGAGVDQRGDQRGNGDGAKEAEGGRIEESGREVRGAGRGEEGQDDVESWGGRGPPRGEVETLFRQAEREEQEDDREHRAYLERCEKRKLDRKRREEQSALNVAQGRSMGVEEGSGVGLGEDRRSEVWEGGKRREKPGTALEMVKKASEEAKEGRNKRRKLREAQERKDLEEEEMEKDREKKEWEEKQRINRMRGNAGAARVILQDEERYREKGREEGRRLREGDRGEAGAKGWKEAEEEEEIEEEIEEEEDRVFEENRKRKRAERAARGKPKDSGGEGGERRGRDKTEKKGGNRRTLSPILDKKGQGVKDEAGSRRFDEAIRKQVKEVLTPFKLREGATDREVAAFISHALTQGQVYRWVHSPATYQGILGTLPSDLVQIMAGTDTYEGVLAALKACASVKEVVLESEKRTELRREFNNLRQGKNQSVGRYAGQLRGVVGRFRDLKVGQDELITVFVANLIPSLHRQMKGRSFDSLEDAIATAQRKEQGSREEEIPPQDIISDARRRGVCSVGGDGRQEEDSTGSRALVGALGVQREKEVVRREELQSIREYDREMDVMRRERAVKEEETRYARREAEKNEDRLDKERKERREAEQAIGINAISRDLPEVKKTIEAGAPLWCAYCMQWCQHTTFECVRAQAVQQGGGRGRGREEPRQMRGARMMTGNTRCYGCSKPGHVRMDCPDTLCYRCNERGHFSFNCQTGGGGRGGGGRGREAAPQQALQYGQAPMPQLQYNPAAVQQQQAPQQVQQVQLPTANLPIGEGNPAPHPPLQNG
jgi:hypothetical protein